jgi:hypothetical protein
MTIIFPKQHAHVQTPIPNMPWCVGLLPLLIHWYPSNGEDRGRKEKGREGGHKE